VTVPYFANSDWSNPFGDFSGLIDLPEKVAEQQLVNNREENPILPGVNAAERAVEGNADCASRSDYPTWARVTCYGAGLIASLWTTETAPTTVLVLSGAMGFLGKIGAESPMLESPARLRTTAETSGTIKPLNESVNIPSGSSGGYGAGKRISSQLRNEWFSEGETPPNCVYCRQNPASELDHVVPRVKQGDLTPENIAPACPHCNRSKGAGLAPITPPENYVGEWPPYWWPEHMSDWWNQNYGGR
jgi:hypothetical protein